MAIESLSATQPVAMYLKTVLRILIPNQPPSLPTSYRSIIYALSDLLPTSLYTHIFWHMLNIFLGGQGERYIA